MKDRNHGLFHRTLDYQDIDLASSYSQKSRAAKL